MGLTQSGRNTNVASRGLAVLWLLVLSVATGCSTFNRDWKAAAAAPTATGLAGCWDGEWRSDVNRHHGRLRAIATPIGADQHRVRFRATYAAIFRFEYAMDMAVGRNYPGVEVFQGEADLGLWGSYRCQGTINTNSWEALYDATHDRGVFQLKRLGTGAR